MANNLGAKTKEQILRENLFVLCDSKEHLHTWVQTYLGINLPGSTVCAVDTDFEPSNSNPMDLLWEIYESARKGDPEKTSFLFYAARGSYKSVLASIIETLCLFHLRRDVGHMAANKKQSKIVQGYLKKYLNSPILRDFMTSKNESEISVTWHERGKIILTPREYKERKDSGLDVAGFTEKRYETTVVVATLGGANGLHCSMMVMDELDLTAEEIISEAMMIPNPGKENQEPPMVLMTSSRKFSTGPVQKTIDTAHQTGFQIRHWNVIDVTKACPSTRHLPERPRLKVFYSNDTLETITEEQFNALPEDRHDEFKADTAYEGCVTKCKMFAMCRGRLATEQKNESPLLRSVEFTQQQFKLMTDVEKAQAQLMCWKPSREGMVYPRLYRDKHMVSAAQIAQIMTGDEFPSTFGKTALLNFLKTQDVTYYAGIDHGYSHCFAGVLGVRWANTMFIIDAFEAPGLELDGKIRIMESRLKSFNPIIFADTSHPGDNKTMLTKHKFNMKKWKKGPGSVFDGIGAVRMKLNPVLMQRPELFFLADDSGVELLFDRLMKYSWVIDAATGEPTDTPNEKDDDVCDAFRYCVMNSFPNRGKLYADASGHENKQWQLGGSIPATQDPTASRVKQIHWQQMLDNAGISTLDDDPSPDPTDGQQKKRGFVWSI